jgi:hypothetical protein
MEKSALGMAGHDGRTVADYEKASGDKIDYSLIPNAPLRQKEISAIQSSVVPDLMDVADPRFTPLNAWSDNLLDIGDLVEPEKSGCRTTSSLLPDPTIHRSNSPSSRRCASVSTSPSCSFRQVGPARISFR